MQVDITYAKFIALKNVTPRISSKLLYTVKSGKVELIFPFSSVSSGVVFKIGTADAPTTAVFTAAFPSAILVEGVTN